MDAYMSMFSLFKRSLQSTWLIISQISLHELHYLFSFIFQWSRNGNSKILSGTKSETLKDSVWAVWDSLKFFYILLFYSSLPCCSLKSRPWFKFQGNIFDIQEIMYLSFVLFPRHFWKVQSNKGNVLHINPLVVQKRCLSQVHWNNNCAPCQ